jgi:FkbM family methyltransferase
LRFAKLQILFLLGRRKAVVPWIDGLKLPIEKGDYGLTGNYYLGMQEFKDMGFLLHLLREGELFLDVGANLGCYSLLAAGSAHAHCLAFEPVPMTYQRFCAVMSFNHLNDKVKARNVALTSPDNAAPNVKLPFSDEYNSSTNSFVSEDYQGGIVYVDVSTLDSECASLAPVLIKIDVEGYEQDVLLGSQSVLRKDSMMALIIEGQTQAVNSLIREAGYTDFSYDPIARQLLPIGSYTFNRIWIKDSRLSEVQDRLRTALRRRVYGRSF